MISKLTIGFGLALSVALAPALALAQMASNAAEAAIERARGEAETRAAACDLSLFLAGDTILTVPWSDDDDPAFLRLIGEIRAADVAIVNLETLIHDFRGFAQADSGGTYMTSPPEIASELTWAGIDMVGHANNHTFDYGAIGVLENLEHVSRAGLVLAGSGPDLEAARAPRSFRHDGGKVALVSMASTFVAYGKASRSRPDLRGRPGLNPLTVTSDSLVTVPPWTAELLGATSRLLGNSGDRFTFPAFHIYGLQFEVGEGFDLTMGRRPLPEDRDANLAAIEAAAQEADFVVASLHYHSRGAWLGRFARAAIDRGADVVHVHGEHKVAGIEIYRGRPIFYGLGDFVYQNALVAKLPSDYYERYGVSLDASTEEVLAAASANGTRGNTARRASFEGTAASLCVKQGTIAEIRLLPLDLHFDGEAPVRGRPYLAAPELGARIIADMQEASDDFDTRIDFDSASGFATVALD